MSQYDEPEYDADPVAEAMAETVPDDAPLPITITGRDKQVVLECIARALLQQGEKELAAALKGQVKAAIETTVVKATEERVVAAVNAAIDDGWQPTNTWGEPAGPKATLRTRIEAIISAKSRTGGYDSPEMTLAERVMREVITQEFHKAFSQQLDAAVKSFRAAVDNQVAAKFAESIKRALGVS